MNKVALISLGCDKNRVDSEKMLYTLTQCGFEITDEYNAETIIINTCGFIEPARKEGIETILEAHRLKNGGACRKIIVTGCMVQKYRSELEKELVEADAFLSLNEYGKLPQLIYSLYNQNRACGEIKEGRLLTTPPHYAYLKIAEGCANRCAFCQIPLIRGAYRSRTSDDIYAEAQKLVYSGVEELILIAQDITAYGQDLKNGQNLLSLLKKLTALDCRYRLMYCYPQLITDELIDFISSSPKICKYIDIPIQHINDRILKLMGRRYGSDCVKTLMTKLKQRGIIVRTTLMAGFPSETQEEFNELCEFVKTYKPQNAGVFAYCREKDTPAYSFTGQLNKNVKQRRADILSEICFNALNEFNRSQIGKTLEVVYEDIDYDNNLFCGRADFQAPDVDGRVLFTAPFADAGKRYKVLITDTRGSDLIGEVK